MTWIRSRWKAVTATIVAFVIGAIAGAGAADQEQEIDRKDSQLSSLRADLRGAHDEIEQGNDALREAQSYRSDALKYRRARNAIKREQAAARRAERERE